MSQPSRPATLRGAVDIPLAPAPTRRTLEDDLARANRRSPIQLAPAPAAPAPKPGTRRRTHGVGAYARGCRCDTCKDAKRDADETYRARTRPGPTVTTVTRHGTTTGYARGCRCAPCKDAKAAENRNRRRTQGGFQ